MIRPAVVAILGILLGTSILWSQVPSAPVEKGQGKVYLGIQAESASADAKATGIRIKEVNAESPAAKAGLRAGDTLVQIGDQAVNDFDQLVSELAKHRPGEMVTLHILRQGKKTSLSATLSERPRQPAPAAPDSSRDRAAPYLGVLTLNLTPELKAKLGVPVDAGAVVAEVLPGSGAAVAGVKENDVITAVGGQAVANPAELREVIQKASVGSTLNLTVQRGQEKKEFAAILKSTPVDGISVIPLPFAPPPGGLGLRTVAPAILEAVEKVTELERRIQELEKRLKEVEKRKDEK